MKLQLRALVACAIAVAALPLAASPSVSAQHPVKRDVGPGAVTPPKNLRISLASGVPDSSWFFGMNLTDQPITTGHYPTTGSQATRLWDAKVAWGDMQPTKPANNTFGVDDPAINWSRLDAAVRDATGSGQGALVYVMGDTPSWAAMRPDQAGCASYLGPGSCSPPSNANFYLNYLRQVVQRYDGNTPGVTGRIYGVQVWNEADNSSYFQAPAGTNGPAYMADLADKTYAMVKKYVPTDWVLAAGLIADPSRFCAPPGAGACTTLFEYNYMQAMENEGWPADVFPISFYPPDVSSVTAAKYWAGLRKTYGTIGVPGYTSTGQPSPSTPGYRPIVWAETNTVVSGDADAYYTPGAARTGPAVVGRTYINAIDESVFSSYWYAWTSLDPIFGVHMTDDGAGAAPNAVATTAYTTIRSWLLGNTWNGCGLVGAVTSCSLGNASTILYSDTGSNPYTIQAGTTSVAALSGAAPTPVSAGQTITVTTEPILLGHTFTAPSAPTSPGADAKVWATGIGNVQIDAGSVLFKWAPPASDGGTPVTSYNPSLPDGGNQCSAQSTTTVWCQYIGTYQQTSFSVSANNAAGTGPASGWTGDYRTVNLGCIPQGSKKVLLRAYTGTPNQPLTFYRGSTVLGTATSSIERFADLTVGASGRANYRASSLGYYSDYFTC